MLAFVIHNSFGTDELCVSVKEQDVDDMFDVRSSLALIHR